MLPGAFPGLCGAVLDVPHPQGSLLSLVLARSFVVVSPAVLYHPHPATLWVHLSDLQGPVQVRVQLQGSSGTPATTLLRREVLEPHLHLNVTFPVSVTPMPPQTSRQQGGGPGWSPGRFHRLHTGLGADVAPLWLPRLLAESHPSP